MLLSDTVTMSLSDTVTMSLSDTVTMSLSDTVTMSDTVNLILWQSGVRPNSHNIRYRVIFNVTLSDIYRL